MTEPDTSIQLDQTAWATLDALLAYPNKTKCAEFLGIGRASLYERIKKYRLDDIMEKIPQAALKTLQLHSERAAETLADGLNDANRKLRYENAERILDRVGLAPKTSTVAIQTNIQQEGGVTYVIRTTESDEEFTRAASETDTNFQ